MCSYTEIHGWRNDMCERLARAGNTVLDPTRHGTAATRDLIEQDKADIDQSDILIAYVPKPSVGTSMEVLYAWERGKAVIIYAPAHAQVSGWLHYHSHAITNHPVDAAAATLTLFNAPPYICRGCGYEIAPVGAVWTHTDERSYQHTPPHLARPGAGR